MSVEIGKNAIGDHLVAMRGEVSEGMPMLFETPEDRIEDLERQLAELKGYRALWLSLSQDVREKHISLIGSINKLKEQGE